MPLVKIVDPNADAAHLWARVVARLGHVPVTDGAHDLVLVDPLTEQGLDAARAARGAESRRPLVCVSIYGDLPDALELEPDAYLVKPFPLADLAGVLGRLLPA